MVTRRKPPEEECDGEGSESRGSESEGAGRACLTMYFLLFPPFFLSFLLFRWSLGLRDRGALLGLIRSVWGGISLYMKSSPQLLRQRDRIYKITHTGCSYREFAH